MNKINEYACTHASIFQTKLNNEYTYMYVCVYACVYASMHAAAWMWEKYWKDKHLWSPLMS